MAERYGVTIPVYRAWEQDNGSRATPDVTFDTDVMTFTDLSWLYRRRLGLTLKAAAATAGKSTSWAHNAEQALSPRAIEEMTEYLLEQRRKDGGW